MERALVRLCVCVCACVNRDRRRRNVRPSLSEDDGRKSVRSSGDLLTFAVVFVC